MKKAFTVELNNYTADVKWCDDDLLYIGRLQLNHGNHSAVFGAATVTDIEKMLLETIASYEEALKEHGVEWNIMIIN